MAVANRFARSIGYHNGTMRKFSLSEMLASDSLGPWLVPESAKLGATNYTLTAEMNARTLSAHLYTVLDAQNILCGSDVIFRGCLPDYIDSSKSVFPDAMDITKDPTACLSFVSYCQADGWNKLFERQWIIDRGMLVLPTSIGLGRLLDSKQMEATRLKGVTGLRVTIEFEGGRVATIDVP